MTSNRFSPLSLFFLDSLIFREEKEKLEWITMETQSVDVSLNLPAAFEGGDHQDGAQHGGDERDDDQHRHPGILAAQFCIQVDSAGAFNKEIKITLCVRSSQIKKSKLKKEKMRYHYMKIHIVYIFIFPLFVLSWVIGQRTTSQTTRRKRQKRYREISIGARRWHPFMTCPSFPSVFSR